MPLVSSFSISQTNTEKSIITWTDTSTGSDVAVTKKRIYLQLHDGTYLVPEGTTTSYIETTGTTLEIDVLSEDKCLRIETNWLNASNAVLYGEDVSDLYVFDKYASEYDYSLQKAQTGNPKLVQDGDYYLNRVRLRCAIDEATTAKNYNDQYAAQSALDRAASFINNQTLFF
jgi:hypothetical protein